MKIYLLVILILLIPLTTNAKESKQIKYKTGIVTANDKIEYLYIAQEKLRIEHNKKGDEFRNGVIAESEWLEWKDNNFLVLSEAISIELQKQKDAFKNSKKYEVDLDKDFENKAP